MLLAIDSSTRVSGLAVLDGDVVVAELIWRTDLNHTRELLPNLERVLTIGGVGGGGDRLGAIDRLAVAVGPGSYGGLRVGVSTAKALALVRGTSIVGVDTLASQAASAGCFGQPIWAALPAGRSELAVGRYLIDAEAVQTLAAPALMTARQLAAVAESGDCVTGELPAEDVAALEQHGGLRILVGPWAVRRPSCVGWLAQRAFARGESAELAALQPVYLRRPAITEPKQPQLRARKE